jgi:hypothetical protein
VLGAIFSTLLILTDQHELPDWHWRACNGLLVLPALNVVVAIHELGHLAAGRLLVSILVESRWVDSFSQSPARTGLFALTGGYWAADFLSPLRVRPVFRHPDMLGWSPADPL